jgi:hypothetical protein
MDAEIVVAIVSAAVAIASGAISIYGQTRVTRLEHQLQQRREAENRKAKTEALIARYRDPLIKSAYDLQSRLYNIVQQGFLRIYYQTSERDKDYATASTLYVIAEFLGWVEILRREVQFLDLGDVEASRRLESLLANIRESFWTDSIELTFRLFRGQQRAIGELMLVERETLEGKHLECIGFAEFVRCLEKSEFARWFEKLRSDVEILANAEHEHEQRLVELQHALIDLIDFLDPDHVRIPSDSRSKITRVRQI